MTHIQVMSENSVYMGHRKGIFRLQGGNKKKIFYRGVNQISLIL